MILCIIVTRARARTRTYTHTHIMIIIIIIIRVLIIMISHGCGVYSGNLSVKKPPKLNALVHTIHTYLHTTHTYIHTYNLYTKNVAPLHLSKGLLKKEGFELSVELREGREIPKTGRQRIPDRWSNETERRLANRFQIAFSDFQ